MAEIFAHSTHESSKKNWELLADHLREVGARASSYAKPFGWAELARAAGLLHDIGKVSAAYQLYISKPPQGEGRGPDHSTAGAREAEALYGSVAGRCLAYAIAGHHAGLADYAELRRRRDEKMLEDYRGWRDHAGELPDPAALRPAALPKPNAHAGFSEAFLTRMLFSCLVDADFLATEQFYAKGAERESFAELATLQGRLSAFLDGKRRDDTELNRLRSCVLDHAVAQAGAEPGLFSLTVPTGGGKTLTSLAFAMEHARRHGLSQVIYVIPYTSIIEQTAAVFRDALGTTQDVLEHHASFDWDPPRRTEDADDEGPAGLAKLRKASENWDAPVVVTTAVQFFESLFARRPSQCRKLHNIANAVVVLDEAQTLPLRLLRPCMAALTELATNYRTSVVLCTATQPALRESDGFTDGLDHKGPAKKVGFKDVRELAYEPQTLFEKLKRVDVERRGGKTEDAEIVERFAEQPRMLCIVNSRRHARELFDALKADPRTAEGACHLTTLMCPVHRREVLAKVRQRLTDQLPVRLVATSLIEAGVDVDFPEVWRAMAGLDSIAQAAGRCNREGRSQRGRTVVFEPADSAASADLRPLIESADGVFRRGLDPLSLEGVQAYFNEVYWRRGAEAMDAATLDGRIWPILGSIAERAGRREFEFETTARAFRLIDEVQETVIVPYDDAAEAILKRLAVVERPIAADLRKLQQYAVSIPRRDRDAWLAVGVLREVHPALGVAFLRFDSRAHYREDTGVDLKAPERRDAAANLI